MPKLTIIIPVYNTEIYLRKCLDSVINQTLTDTEIICINDGSTDNSLSILKEYAALDHRIRIIDKKNGGQGVARNIAIRQAAGEYLGFIDSDDWADLHMFEELYKSAKKYSADVTLCELELYNPKNGVIYQPSWTKIPFDRNFDNSSFHWSDDLENIFKINSGPFNRIYKTDFVKKIDAQFAEGLHFEDILFVFNCILNATILNFIRTPLYVNRYYREGSTSSDKGKKQFDIFVIFKKLEDSIEHLEKYPLLRDKFYEYRYSRYLFHLDEVNHAYKNEFWNNIVSEFNDLETDQKESLLRNNFPLKVGIKHGVSYYNNFRYLQRILQPMINLIFGHNIQGRLRAFVNKLT
jgi:glycosyltransferase involved in cell wall biosynthesis